MKERILTAIGLISVVLFATFIHPDGILYLLYLFIAVATYEVFELKVKKFKIWVLFFILSFVFWGGWIDFAMYGIYVSVLMVSLFVLTIFFDWFEFEDLTYLFLMIMLLTLAIQSIQVVLAYGNPMLFYIFIATFATDTFAFFGGYFFGKHKLAPKISPKKTIEGSISGFVMSVIISLAFAYFVIPNKLPAHVFVVVSLVIPIISQIGDLSFSIIKRQFKLKDFGRIFPGHGGVLDRIDSVIFALIAFNLIILVL